MTTINSKLRVRADKEIKSTVERVLVLINEEMEAFYSGAKGKGNYGVTQLSKDVEKRAGISFQLAYGLCSAYTGKLGIVGKKGPQGGFPKPNLPDAAPSAPTVAETAPTEPPPPVETPAVEIPAEPQGNLFAEEPAPETAPLSHAAE